MAITKGLLAAVEERLREGSEGDTRSPICDCKQTASNYQGLDTYQEGTADIDCIEGKGS